MESEDKRHIQRICGRVSLALVVLTACRSQADGSAVDADVEAAIPIASTRAPIDAAAAVPAARPSTVYGEWERQSEPYKGMRFVLRPRETKAIVTRSSSVDADANNKAELECQRSLWKRGDVLISDFGGQRGMIVVRDWGLTAGVCRHQDTKAQADFIFADPDVLVLTVTRGNKRVAQEWTRVE
jgi:hypothetical protein